MSHLQIQSAPPQALTENPAGNLCKSPVAAVYDRRGHQNRNKSAVEDRRCNPGPTFAEISAGVHDNSPGSASNASATLGKGSLVIRLNAAGRERIINASVLNKYSPGGNYR